MKKILSSIALACFLLTGTATFAQGTKNAGQDAATNEGDLILDIGIGFGGGYYDNNSYNYNNGNGNSSSSSGLPTFSISLQKAFWEDITIGGEIAFNTYQQENTWNNGNGTKAGYQKYNQNNSFFLGKGEYHFNRLIGLDPKFDLYAGAVAGLRFSGSKSQYTDYNNNNYYSTSKSNSTNFELGAFGGFRYYFVEGMAVYAEVGWAITPFRTGLAWKF